MKKVNKSEFIEKSTRTLSSIYDTIEGLPPAKLSGLKSSETVLVIVDMINGFAKEGMLSSSRVDELIPNIVKLGKLCGKAGVPAVVFGDCHGEDSPEFDSYPKHCINGTSESEIVDELKELKAYTFIAKNSTNGFLEEEFKKWLQKNSNINNFIIVGDCTDICILQFSETLKAYFNMQNRRVNVIVPVDCVDTFDGGLHDADLMNVFSLFNMMGNGINVVKRIEE